MANWDKITSRGNVDDRRGNAPLAFGGIGIIGVVLYLLLSFVGNSSPSTNNLNEILSQLQPNVQQQDINGSGAYAGEDDYQKFVSTVIGSNNDVWKSIFQAKGVTYVEPKLVLFRQATQSGCGVSSSQVGPHYCPADKTIYIDETFFDELKKLGGSNGDVAQAYVLSHEVGHHVQNLLGTLNPSGQIPDSANSVRLELQADCYAGIWAHSIKNLGVFLPGEIDQATSAAEAVGDDRIQKNTTGQINPETWTHGSSQQRVESFNKGLNSGTLASCETS